MTRALRSRALAGIAALAALLVTAAPAAAEPSAFDGGFGSGGVLTVGVQLLGVAVQPNGEIVAAGQSAGKVFVERFTTSGAPDGSYTGPTGAARAVAIAPNGDIVVGGTSGGAMLVERLSSGLAVSWSATAFAGQGGVANGLALAPDGGIVAVGSVGGAPTAAAAAKFSSGGGTSWAQTYGLGGNSVFSGVAVEPDGTSVAVGKRNPSQAIDALIVWLNSGGGQSNATTLDYPGSGATALSGATLQTNGQIVVAGQTTSSNLPAAIFARYDTNGSLDTSFGANGVRVVPASSGLSNNAGGLVGAYGVGLTGPQGQIVGGGSFSVGAAFNNAAVWSIGPGGAVDSNFGSGGTQLGPGSTSPLDPGYEACALAIAPDGSPDAGEIVTVGDSPTVPNLNPCATGESSRGFIASTLGYGPPPPPPMSSGAAPAVTTGASMSVSATSATLTGVVNPNGLQTSYHFEYGTTASYGQSTPATSAGSGTSAVLAAASVSGLSPNTTYHYRIVATNADGTTTGADKTFKTTAPAAPSVTTGSASSVSHVSARIHGSVRANGLPTTYHFEFGKSKSYGSSTTSHSIAGTASVNVSEKLTRLKPGTTYHYRIDASNANGAVTGSDRTFKTQHTLRSRLHGVNSTYKIADVLKGGLSFKVGCNQRCSISGSLLISGTNAKKLGLGKHKMSIALGTATLDASGTTNLVLHVKKADKTAVSSQKSLSVTLSTVSSSRGGTQRIINTKTITLIA